MRALVLLTVLVLAAPILGPVAAREGALPAAPITSALLAAGPHGAAPLAIETLAPLATDDPTAALLRLAPLVGAAVAPVRAQPVAPAWLAEAPASLRPALAILAGGHAQAEIEVALALAALPSSAREDVAFALSDARATARGDATDEERARFARLQIAAAAVDHAALVRAELAMLDAIEQAAPLWPSETPDAIVTGCAGGTVLFAAPACTVVVGNTGPNVYTNDIVLLVDLGGADRYENNAGGTGARGFGAGLLWDRGSDSDVHVAQLTFGAGVQGGGSFGAGLLVDEGGSDVYTTDSSALGDATQVAAQGSGILGIGVLWDRGAGDDAYASRKLPQGAGLIGDGLLLDEGGSDDYIVTYTFDSEGGQGTGCYGSFGALVDQGAGADLYDATIDDMQGFGCIAGLGVLLDADGNDQYVLRAGLGDLGGATVVQSGWGQAYGELGGTGVLLDASGDDTYTVTGTSANSGQQTQGVGILGGAAVLADLGGNDDYRARTTAQGSGTAGLGVLFDADGADAYHALSSCQGAGLAQGALVDTGGDADVYDCPERPLVGTRANTAAWSGGIGGIGIDA